jgi:hypothetical protein
MAEEAVAAFRFMTPNYVLKTERRCPVPGSDLTPLEPAMNGEITATDIAEYRPANSSGNEMQKWQQARSADVAE